MQNFTYAAYYVNNTKQKVHVIFSDIYIERERCRIVFSSTFLLIPCRSAGQSSGRSAGRQLVYHMELLEKLIYTIWLFNITIENPL